MPDIVFIFGDPEPILPYCSESANRSWKLILYITIDGFPIPTTWKQLFKADRIVTMSPFSKKVIDATYPCEAKSTSVIPAPADTARFQPIPDATKLQARHDILPDWIREDSFILGFVGRNQWRKQLWLAYYIVSLIRSGQYYFCQNCGAVSLTADTYRCRCSLNKYTFATPILDVHLWIHDPTGGSHGTWNIRTLETMYNLLPGRDLHYTEGCSPSSHLRPDDMPLLYNIWDALLYLSGGEGFGMPALESMASGLPVIYSDYSAHAEMLRRADAGIAVPGVLQPEAGCCIQRIISDPAAAVAAVRKLYYNSDERRRLGKNGRHFATVNELDLIVSNWHNMFQEFSDGS